MIKQDFFAFTESRVATLNQTEREIYEYVVRNLHAVKDKSIRTLSHECYISTTTMIRFVRKLGFAGYSDFINLLRLTDFSASSTFAPAYSHWESQDALIKGYLKSIEETVRIASPDKVAQFGAYLAASPRIFLLSDGLCGEVAFYARHLFTVLGFEVFAPREQYEIRSAIRQIRQDDLLWVISMTGQEKSIINTMERILSERQPVMVSITGLGNNIIQSTSDLNFYVFSTPVLYQGNDISSCAPMLAVVEILAHSWLAKTTAPADHEPNSNERM